MSRPKPNIFVEFIAYFTRIALGKVWGGLLHIKYRRRGASIFPTTLSFWSPKPPLGEYWGVPKVQIFVPKHAIFVPKPVIFVPNQKLKNVPKRWGIGVYRSGMHTRPQGGVPKLQIFVPKNKNPTHNPARTMPKVKKCVPKH